MTSPSSADIARMVARNLGFHYYTTDIELGTIAGAFQIMEPEVATNMAVNWPTGDLIDCLKSMRDQLVVNAKSPAPKPPKGDSNA